MKILIVNGFAIDEEGIRSLAEFEEIIRTEFSHQKELVDTETDFFIRDRLSIEDLLYEPESGFLNRGNAMNFDNYDMIFLAGPTTLLPWNKAANNVFSKRNSFELGDGLEINH